MKNERWIPIDQELMALISLIHKHSAADENWCEYPSCDLLQNEKYCGGFEPDDAGSGEFTFSMYESGAEVAWISIPKPLIPKIIAGEISTVLAYDPC